jgi:hypothetical protein
MEVRIPYSQPHAKTSSYQYIRIYMKVKNDELVKSCKILNQGRLRKKGCRQGARNPRSEAYFAVRRNDEGGSATQHPDFLRSRQK